MKVNGSGQRGEVEDKVGGDGCASVAGEREQGVGNHIHCCAYAPGGWGAFS